MAAAHEAASSKPGYAGHGVTHDVQQREGGEEHCERVGYTLAEGSYLRQGIEHMPCICSSCTCHATRSTHMLNEMCSARRHEVDEMRADCEKAPARAGLGLRLGPGPGLGLGLELVTAGLYSGATILKR